MVTAAYSVHNHFYRYQTSPETVNKCLHIPAEDLCSINPCVAAQVHQEVENTLSLLGPTQAAELDVRSSTFMRPI